MGKKNKNQNKKNKNIFDQEEKSEEDDLRIWKKAIHRFKHGIDIVVFEDNAFIVCKTYTPLSTVLSDFDILLLSGLLLLQTRVEVCHRTTHYQHESGIATVRALLYYGIHFELW